MSINRRDLLKLFGIGAIAVPVLGGAPQMEAAVQIIEVPKIQPVELYTVYDIPNTARQLRPKPLKMTVIFETDEGKSLVFQTDTFITEAKVETIDITSYQDQFRAFAPGTNATTWELKGRLLSGTRTRF